MKENRPSITLNKEFSFVSVKLYEIIYHVIFYRVETVIKKRTILRLWSCKIEYHLHSSGWRYLLIHLLLCSWTCECVLFIWSWCVCAVCPIAGFCSGETDLLGVSVDPHRWWRHRLRHTARQPQNQKVSFCAAFSLDQGPTRYFVWIFFNPTSSEPSAEPLTSKITRLVYIFQLPSVVNPLKLFHIALKKTQAPSFFLKVTDTEVVVTDWRTLRP